jgi:hypothetical protein
LYGTGVTGDPGRLGEACADDLPDAVAIAERDLAGICLCIRDQLLHAVDRQLGIHDDDHRDDHDAGDRREILDRIVGQLLEQEGIGRVRRVGGHEQRVAVRRRFRRGLGADDGRSARLVVDDEGLIEGGLELVGDEARDDVGGAAGGEGHDDPHRPVGIALGPDRRGGGEADNQ